MKKRTFFIIILLIAIILILASFLYSKFITEKIGNNFKNAMTLLKNSENYYILYTTTDKENNQTIKKETFVKNGKSIIKEKILTYDKNQNLINEVFEITYDDGKQGISIQEKPNKFVLYHNSNGYGWNGKALSVSIDYISNYLIGNSELKIDNVKFGKFNNHECYIVTPYFYKETVYIDKNSYLPIGYTNRNGENYTCTIKLGTVKDSDFELPDITEYEIRDSKY